VKESIVKASGMKNLVFPELEVYKGKEGKPTLNIYGVNKEAFNE
jgi:phosphopantetheinyl transferase (holo-ACP synthase)